MGKRKIPRAALAGALCLPILPALAQEGGGVLYSFGVSETVRVGNNLALDTPAQGTSTIADTNLTFGILSEREDQTLDLDMGLSLTIENTPDTGSSTEFGVQNPFIALSYGREAPNAAFGLNLDYRESEIDQLSLSDFINDDGVLDIPEDFDGLFGSGTRSAYGADVTLELGVDAPLGFNLEAGVSGINYSGSVDPDLFDYDRTNLGAEAVLEFSPVLSGTVGLDYSTYDAANPEQTYRTTTDGTVGIDYALSPRADLSARVGVTQIETEEFGASTVDVTNPIWSFGLDYDMPNGVLTADLDLSSDDDGAERRNLVVGRSMDLPDGELFYSLGLTDPESGDIEPIGSLSWQRALPAGSLEISLNRAVRNSNTDETQLFTSFAAEYDHRINTISSVGLNLFYGQTDSTTGTPGTTQSEISATYNHALTDEWDLVTGVSYQTRDEDTVGSASSPSVFLTIGRRFDFRP